MLHDFDLPSYTATLAELGAPNLGSVFITDAKIAEVDVYQTWGEGWYDFCKAVARANEGSAGEEEDEKGESSRAEGSTSSGRRSSASSTTSEAPQASRMADAGEGARSPSSAPSPTSSPVATGSTGSVVAPGGVASASETDSGTSWFSGWFGDESSSAAGRLEPWGFLRSRR